MPSDLHHHLRTLAKLDKPNGECWLGPSALADGAPPRFSWFIGVASLLVVYDTVPSRTTDLRPRVFGRERHQLRAEGRGDSSLPLQFEAVPEFVA